MDTFLLKIPTTNTNMAGRSGFDWIIVDICVKYFDIRPIGSWKALPFNGLFHYVTYICKFQLYKLFLKTKIHLWVMAYGAK